MHLYKDRCPYNAECLHPSLAKGAIQRDLDEKRPGQLPTIMPQSGLARYRSRRPKTLELFLSPTIGYTLRKHRCAPIGLAAFRAWELWLHCGLSRTRCGASVSIHPETGPESSFSRLSRRPSARQQALIKEF